MLTQDDFDHIEEVVDDKIKSRTSKLPTKDEFFSKMAEVMGELKAICEDQSILNGKSSDHEKRIGKLENKVGIVSV